jgi:hypothetical protein
MTARKDCRLRVFAQITPNVLRLCVCLPLAQGFNLTTNLMGANSTKPLLCVRLIFFVLIFSKLETIFKINKKYLEKSLQLSK